MKLTTELLGARTHPDGSAYKLLSYMYCKHMNVIRNCQKHIHFWKPRQKYQISACKNIFISFSSYGPLLSWSYGSWIYNYLCNQCLSPLMVWVWIPLRQGILNTTLCDSLSVTCGRSVVFSTNKTDRHNKWNIVESGIKHHNPPSHSLWKTQRFPN